MPRNYGQGHQCCCRCNYRRRRRCGSCNLFPCRSVQLRPHRNDVLLRVLLYPHLRRIWRMFLFQCRSRCRSALLSSPRRHSCGTGRRHTLFLPLGTDGKTPLCCTRYTGCVLQNRCHRRENTHSFSGLSLRPMLNRHCNTRRLLRLCSMRGYCRVSVCSQCFSAAACDT